MKGTAFDFQVRDRCPACDSTSSRTRYCCSFNDDPIASYLRQRYRIDTAALAEADYQLDECQTCGTIYQAQVGERELLTELYSKWISRTEPPENDPGYVFDVANPLKSRDGHEIMAAASFVDVPLSRMQVLDYGMGWASWSRIAVQLGCNTFGTDLADERIEFARKHGITPLRDTEIGERRFHFINTEQSMEHLTDPASVVKRLAGALQPGGILKISVPSNRGVEPLLKRLNAGQPTVTHAEIMPVHPLEHVNCFTREGLARLGRRFGLKPVTPGMVDRFAFLRRRGSLAWNQPKRLAKELVRPWYQFHNPRNLYVWLRKPS